MPYKNPADEKACRLRNRHKKLAYMRRYAAANRERENGRCRKWYRDNKDYALEQQKVYAQAHPEVRKKAVRKYQTRKRLDPEWQKAQAKKMRDFRSKNREAFNARMRKYANSRYESDANFKLRALLRARVRSVLFRKGLRKTFSATKIVGCDIQFLRGYLEARFLPGMTWANHGKWHIDHYIPCAEFDLREPTQQRQCFNYSNLKPLWGPDNISKGAKRPASHQAELV